MMDGARKLCVGEKKRERAKYNERPSSRASFSSISAISLKLLEARSCRDGVHGICGIWMLRCGKAPLWLCRSSASVYCPALQCGIAKDEEEEGQDCTLFKLSPLASGKVWLSRHSARVVVVVVVRIKDSMRCRRLIRMHMRRLKDLGLRISTEVSLGKKS